MKSSTPIIVKLLLNQVVMSIFGTMLTIATITVSDNLCATASLIPIFLYFFLIYNTMWDKGARDVISSQHTHKNTIGSGFVTALLAAIPTIVCTLCFSLITDYMTNINNLLNTLDSITNGIVMIGLQGMYYGIANLYGYSNIVYLIAVLPAIIVGGAAYIMGYKNIRIIPETKRK